jgi:hypothetical protein
MIFNFSILINGSFGAHVPEELFSSVDLIAIKITRTCYYGGSTHLESFNQDIGQNLAI